MRSTLGKTLFAIGDLPYLWADVVLYGALSGEWPAVVERAKAGWTALEREDAAGEELVDDAEIEAEADRFRYDRELVSADDTERWLATWGLDVDAWLTWIRADLIRKRFEREDAESGAVAPRAEIDDEDLEEAVWAEAVCSGALGGLARRLAGRAAIARKLAEDGEKNGLAAVGAEEPLEIPSLDVESLVPGFPPEQAQEHLRAIARLDREFLAFRDQVVTPEAVAARVRAHQGDWMRVDCRVLTMSTEDVAREALLSIQEDGEEMADVAAGSGGEIREGTFYLEELDRGISDRVLAARKGELLGPIRTSDGYALVAVVDKRLASVDDEEIRKRAETSLFDSLVEREMDNRVTWRWGR